MFDSCKSSEVLDHSQWEVGRVTNMFAMFRGCRFLNFDVSGWDVSKVTEMDAAFDGCESLNNAFFGLGRVTGHFHEPHIPVVQII